MFKNHPQVCLYQPDIPQNTGNVGRLVAATQSRLHLIKPFGFGTSDKNLRRAGLDYWPFLDLEIHNNLEDLLSNFQPNEIAFLSTKATKAYTKIPAQNKLLVFGSETKGLPDWVHEKHPEQLYKIPMYHEGVRSLNLSNSVSIVLYHSLAQLHKGN